MATKQKGTAWLTNLLAETKAEHLDELGPLGQQFAEDLIDGCTMAQAVGHFLDNAATLQSLDDFTDFERGVWHEIVTAHDKWTRENPLN